MRRSVNSTDPQAVLEASILKATSVMQPHYEVISAGFTAWRAKTKGTGVRAKDAVWTSGDLTVSLRHLIGLRLPKGSEVVVLTYVKESALTQDMADLVLRIMEHAMPEVLPGATPVIVDTRRGKPFKLRANANRADLDGVLAAEAAKYVTHWLAA